MKKLSREELTRAAQVVRRKVPAPPMQKPKKGFWESDNQELEILEEVLSHRVRSMRRASKNAALDDPKKTNKGLEELLRKRAQRAATLSLKRR